jgi:hypothetical protein
MHMHMHMHMHMRMHMHMLPVHADVDGDADLEATRVCCVPFGRRRCFCINRALLSVAPPPNTCAAYRLAI